MAEQADVEWISDSLKCPICFSVLKVPVDTPCQHTFCQACILRCVSVKSVCPLCRTPVRDERDLKINRLAASMIQEQMRLHAEELTKDKTVLSTTAPSPQGSGTVMHLSMTKSYASHWTARQGVRECVQNWYDALQEHPYVQNIRSKRKNASHSISLLDHDFAATRVSSDVSHLKLSNDPAFYPVQISVEKPTSSSSSSASSFSTLVAHSTYPSPAAGSATYQASYMSNALGWVAYDPQKQSLTLTNFDCSLKRQILLLGYSTKTKKAHLVGQFGEGMKVGILALLRAGKGVEMHTGTEKWTFFLGEDENFGNELVLSVIMEGETERHADGGGTTSSFTRTIVSNLSDAEWRAYERDFLFLRPSQDYVNTESGVLLLDTQQRHKLFVKGFWIADLESEGLTMGVNLYDMQLDRDRRAVVKRSEIEMKISDIWAKAILVKNSLLPIYFDMLMQDEQLIRHGSLYISDRGIELLAAHFTQTHGSNAFPVHLLPGADTEKEGKKLSQVQERLNVRPIHVPESLYSILSRARTLQTFEALQESLLGQTRSRVLKSAELTTEQQSVLARACTIVVHGIDPSLSSRGIEVWLFVEDDTELVIPSDASAPVRISSKLLSIEHVHMFHERCASLPTTAGAPSSAPSASSPVSSSVSSSLSKPQTTPSNSLPLHFADSAAVAQMFSLADLLSPSARGSTCEPCFCREIRIVQAYITQRALVRAKNPLERSAFEKLMGERLMHALLVPILSMARHDKHK